MLHRQVREKTAGGGCDLRCVARLAHCGLIGEAVNRRWSRLAHCACYTASAHLTQSWPEADVQQGLSLTPQLSVPASICSPDLSTPSAPQESCRERTGRHYSIEPSEDHSFSNGASDVAHSHHYATHMRESACAGHDTWEYMGACMLSYIDVIHSFIVHQFP